VRRGTCGSACRTFDRCRTASERAPFWAAEHWCQEESGKVRHSFELVVLVCALLMLPAVLIQDSGLLHSPWGLVSAALGVVVWLVFALELTLTHALDRRAALRAHWQDALVVVVIFPLWRLLFAAIGPGWLRAWRLTRLWAIAAGSSGQRACSRAAATCRTSQR